MQTTNNTILITGGASGIGRGLAEAFHKLGNQVIIAGRRQSVLDAVTQANPGMKSVRMDITEPSALRDFAAQVTRQFPALNVLINNAGIMKPEKLAAAPDYVDVAEETIETNLLGPIRLTAALLPHLQKQANAAVMMVTSGLAFVPLAATPTYSATKAALHSYTASMRHQLAGSNVQVVEIAPPYVQTHLMGDAQASDPRAMNLSEFIAEVMQIMTTQPDVQEVIVERCRPLRNAAAGATEQSMFETINGMEF